MRLRELGLVEIKKRVKDNRVALNLKTFKRSPTRPIDSYDYPCVFMLEGEDTILERSRRGKFDYPQRRELEVTLEIITDESYDIKQLYRDVRSTVFGTEPVVADNSFIREIRTEGPTGYGLPDVLGMRLVLGLQYIDHGD